MHQDPKITVLRARYDHTHLGNHSCYKQTDMETNIQEPASQHTQGHSQTARTQQANSQCAGGMGEALRYVLATKLVYLKMLQSADLSILIFSHSD